MMKRFKRTLAFVIAVVFVMMSFPITLSGFADDTYEKISVGDTLTVSLASFEDSYYVEFLPEKDGTYAIYSTSDMDTRVWLHAENMDLLASDDDSGDNYNFLLAYDFTAGNTYFFEFGTWEEAGGSYSVALTEAPDAEEVYIDSELTGYAGGTYYISQEFVPAISGHTGMTWSSDNEQVATVDNYGDVFMHEKGTAIITARLKNGFESHCTVTVKEPLIMVEDTYCNVEIVDNTAVSILFTPEEDGEYVFCARNYSNSNRASFDLFEDGRFLLNGSRKMYADLTGGVTYTLSTSYDYYHDSGSGSYDVLVSKAVSATDLLIIGQSEFEVYAGNILTVDVNLYPWNAHGESFTLTSGDESVAVVDDEPSFVVGTDDTYYSYLVSAVGVGQTTITAVSESGFTVTFNVTVNDTETLSAGETKTAVISTMSSSAIFKFIPEKSGTYVFKSLSDDDTLGIIFDSNMEEITRDDDGGLNSNFKLVYDFTAGEIYYLEAKYWDNFLIGSFDVSLYEAREITNLEILTLPTNLDYVQGYVNTIDLSGMSMNVTWSDGSTTVWDMDRDGDTIEEYYVCQYFDSETATVTVECDGQEVQFTVNYVDNPVDHLEIVSWSNTPLIENINGYYDERFNMDTFEYEEYFHYELIDNPWNAVIKIVFKDESSTIASIGEDVGGYWIQYYDKQYDEPWTVGENHIIVTYLGVEVYLPVTVVPDPVESISAHYTSVLTEGINCDEIYDEEGYLCGLDYFVKYDDIVVTVNYKDGTVLTCTAGELYDKTNYMPELITRRSEFEVWGVGKHTATLLYLGHAADFEIEVVENIPEDLPFTEIKDIPTPVNWEKLDKNIFDVYGDGRFGIYDYTSINDDKKLSVSSYIYDDDFEYNYYLSFFDGSLNNLIAMYSAEEIMRKYDTLAENEIVYGIEMSPITIDGAEKWCYVFEILEDYETWQKRYVIFITDDGLNFTKYDMPYTLPSIQLPYTTCLPSIAQYKSTFIFYGDESNLFYTTEDFVNWSRHSIPNCSNPDGVPNSVYVFNITDNGVYFIAKSFYYMDSYTTAVGIYFTKDFFNYVPIVEHDVPRLGSGSSKWMYYTGLGLKIDDDSFAILQVEYPSDKMVQEYDLFSKSLDAKLLVYNEKTGKMKELHSWKDKFDNYGCWYNFCDSNIEIYTVERGNHIMTVFDMDGKILSRHKLENSVFSIIMQSSMEKDDLHYDWMFCPSEFLISFDYGASHYSINLPDDVLYNAYMLIEFGDQTAIIANNIYVCDTDEYVSDYASKISLEKDNVKVTGVEGTVFDSNVELVVENKGQDVPQAVSNQLGEQNFVAYDITLQQDGVVVQPSGKVEVSIRIPEDMLGKNIRVLRVESNESLMDMDAKIKDGIATFTTGHFSTYILAEAKYTKGDFDNDGEITVADALAALRIAAKLVNEDDTSIAIGDVDGDSHVTVADALAILRVAAKLADSLGYTY